MPRRALIGALALACLHGRAEGRETQSTREVGSSAAGGGAEAPVQPASRPDPGGEPVEARLQRLELELARLRLQAAEEPAPPPLSLQSGGGVSPNVLNPRLTVIGNALYRYDDRAVRLDDSRVDNQFNLREVELDLRAAVDPFADGVVILAFPSEVVGEFGVEVEEAYVTIKHLPLPLLDEPPLGLKLKVGRFRTEVGRVNRLHLHDLPQVNRPLVSDEFFGADGFIGNGLSAQGFLPTPFDEGSVVELTAQLLTGGGAALADGPARSPAVVANLRWFRTFASAHNLDLSLIYHYGRTDPAHERSAHTVAADVLYKWKPLRGGEFHSFVIGGELLYADRHFLAPTDSNGDGEPDSEAERHTTPLGYFAFAQAQAWRTIYLGVRWDDTATIADSALRRHALSGYVTWYPSEFLRFRLGYEHRFSDLAEEDGLDSAFAELNFIIGSHPPEPFWVNK